MLTFLVYKQEWIVLGLNLEKLKNNLINPNDCENSSNLYYIN